MAIQNDDFESGTDGSTLTGFDAMVTNGGPATYSAAAAVHGALGGSFVTTTNKACFVRRNLTDQTKSSLPFRIYFKFASIPSGNPAFYRPRDTNGYQGSISIASDGTLYVYDGASGYLHDSATVLSAGTVYRLEGVIDAAGAGASSFTGHIYEGDSTTALETSGSYTSTTLNFGSGPFMAVDFGVTNGVTDVTLYVDDVAENPGDTGLIGPAANSAPTVTPGAAQTVNSGTEVTVTASAADSDGTVSSLTGAFTSYAGSSAPTLTGTATGTGTASASLSQTFTPTTAGQYVWQATATDDDSATSTGTTTVTVLGTTSYPNGVSENSGGWTNEGGAASLQAAVSDGSNDTYAESPDSPSDDAITFGVDPYLQDGDITVTFTAAGSESGRSITVELMQGGTSVASKTQALTTTPTEYTLALSSAENSAITDRTVLYVRATAS